MLNLKDLINWSFKKDKERHFQQVELHFKTHELLSC